MKKRILLVEPEFPIPKKSKNHKNFLPIGLLKLHSYYRSLNYKTKIVRGNLDKRKIGTRFIPDEILITSLFTYWSKYVWETVEYYRSKYPDSKITIGGIYASLLGKSNDFQKKLKKYNAHVHTGLHQEAERYVQNNKLDYSYLSNPQPIDYQIIHASRGCNRNCAFCGTWKIEPDFYHKKSIKKEIVKDKIVFYDNNFLMNHNIKSILDELKQKKKRSELKWCECQSGFDGRILQNDNQLAKELKDAGFRNVRIAWDGPFKENRDIKKQLDILNHAGFNYKEIYVFMIFNWIITFEEMEKKRKKCFDWGVQISDCRFRPLDQLVDNYNPRLSEKGQTSDDYYIHEKGGWTDTTIRQFRKNIRRQNICIRQHYPLYIKDFEHKKYPTELLREVKSIDRIKEKKEFLKKNEIVYWDPSRKCGPWKGKLR